MPRLSASSSSSNFCQSKIEHLRLARICHHYVSRLDIAMNDAARVCGRQRICYLNRDPQCAVEFKRTTIYKLPHVATFDVLHSDVVQSISFAKIENGADVRVIEC